VRYVLDANIAIAAMNGVAAVRDRLARIGAAEVGIPLVAIAELVFGAYRSRRREENLARVTALRQTVHVLPVTDEVVDRYGATRADLESRGIVKSDFDLVIACTALEQAAVLVSSDRALLDGSIAGLQAENWLARTG
jgi:tRNA(fMet)-specific endonuclease VapC